MRVQNYLVFHTLLISTFSSHKPVKSGLLHSLFYTSIFTDMILCPEIPFSNFFLVKSYSFFRNQIKYHFLSEAIHDFPRIAGHHSTIIQKSSVNTHDYGTYDVKCKDLLT